MLAETKKRLAQLVEINKGLAQDLDVSRRVVADLSRERDVLRRYVGSLESQVQQSESHDAYTRRRQEAEIDAIGQEQSRILREAELANERAEDAEQKLQSLISKFRQVEKERDDALSLLAESTAAMDEIRYRLSGLPDMYTSHRQFA